LCTSCHGLETVTHARNTPRSWKPLVDDMIARGGTGTDDQAQLIVDYLSRNFGVPVNVNTATDKQLQEGLDATATESAAIIKNRPYKELGDLLRVPGANAEKLRQMSANITF